MRKSKSLLEGIIVSITSEWNLKQKRLKEIIRKSENFDEAKELFLLMHKMVHFSEMSYCKNRTILDEIWKDLSPKDFSIMPSAKDVTIAWNIWHITRIEDLTGNILINNSHQILNDDWLQRLNIQIKDTGNSMTDEEIISLSKSLNIDELRNYRNKVGRQTENILQQLSKDDMKKRFRKGSLSRIFEEGGVLDHPDSIWLIDFWGKKDVAGIILMPITRYKLVHLNDCVKIKNKIKRKNFISN